MSLTLVIGNKNYSSWSLRPWLAMKQAGIAFNESTVLLARPETKEKILRYSPSGRVPCLIDGQLTVFDSLAVCEYVNEQHADGTLWPRDVAMRAQARSVAAEMHSGFAALRTHMPMDIRSRDADKGQTALRREDVAADVARIQAVWTEYLIAGRPNVVWKFFDRRCVLRARRDALRDLRRQTVSTARGVFRLRAVVASNAAMDRRSQSGN